MTSSTFAAMVPSAVLASAVMLVLWMRQTRTRDATIVDVGWAALLVATRSGTRSRRTASRRGA